MFDPGSRFSHYIIGSPIGAGGMGEVYRAEDTKLGRAVAIKVLTDAFARDRDRVERFEREARTLASINHPNIAQIYGFEEGAIVMELLEGSTLREQLNERPLPIRKAVEYAVQIARGLAAAHERGIIHRDLKPENIFVTRDGFIKLLDFGLARVASTRTAGSDANTAAATAVTQAGTVMGTVGYMAPEQVRGESVDSRADLFAFGAVLYEMVSGRRAFSRDTPAETMTAVLREEPADLLTADASIPAAVDRIIRHCLEKSPTERFQSARDVAFALETVATGSAVGSGTSTASSTAKRAGRGSTERLAWAAMCATLGVVALWLGLAREPAPAAVAEPAAAYRAIVPLPEGLQFGNTPIPPLSLALSPDGQRVAIVGRTARASSIWLHTFAQGTWRELKGTEDGIGPTWAPDSARFTFSVRSSAKMFDTTNDRVTDLPEAVFVILGSTSQALTMTGGPGAWRVGTTKERGAPIVPLLGSLEDGSYFGPTWLPDSRHFTVVHSKAAVNARIEMASVDGGAPVLLVDGGITGRVAADHLVYVRGERLMAQRLDVAAGQLTGEPTTLADHVLVSANTGGAVSASDGLIAYMSNGSSTYRLTWVDRQGQTLSTVGDEGDFSNIELSRDERRIAVSLPGPRGVRDIYLADLSRSVLQRLTTDASDERAAIWSPDGRRIIYNSRGLDLYSRPSDFSGSDESVVKDGVSKDPRDISFDGTRMLFRRSGQNSNNDIWMMNLTGDPRLRAIAETAYNENYASFSPDARSVVYVSDESLRPEVYVVSLDAKGGKAQISSGGGTFPRWRNANEIVYISDDTLMSVAVRGSGDTFSADVAKPLFKVNAQGGPGVPYDQTADGKRFIVIAKPPERLPPSLNIIVNWRSLLPRQ